MHSPRKSVFSNVFSACPRATSRATRHSFAMSCAERVSASREQGTHTRNNAVSKRPFMSFSMAPFTQSGVFWFVSFFGPGAGRRISLADRFPLVLLRVFVVNLLQPAIGSSHGRNPQGLNRLDRWRHDRTKTGAANGWKVYR